jgi:hypothetical protein
MTLGVAALDSAAILEWYDKRRVFVDAPKMDIRGDSVGIILGNSPANEL